MLLSALTGMSLSACSDSDDATQTPDGETTGEGGETGDNENENDKTVVIDYTVAEAPTGATTTWPTARPT